MQARGEDGLRKQFVSCRLPFDIYWTDKQSVRSWKEYEPCHWMQRRLISAEMNQCWDSITISSFNVNTGFSQRKQYPSTHTETAVIFHTLCHSSTEGSYSWHINKTLKTPQRRMCSPRTPALSVCDLSARPDRLPPISEKQHSRDHPLIC